MIGMVVHGVELVSSLLLTQEESKKDAFCEKYKLRHGLCYCIEARFGRDTVRHAQCENLPRFVNFGRQPTFANKFSS